MVAVRLFACDGDHILNSLDNDSLGNRLFSASYTHVRSRSALGFNKHLEFLTSLDDKRLLEVRLGMNLWWSISICCFSSRWEFFEIRHTVLVSSGDTESVELRHFKVVNSEGHLLSSLGRSDWLPNFFLILTSDLTHLNMISVDWFTTIIGNLLPSKGDRVACCIENLWQGYDSRRISWVDHQNSHRWLRGHTTSSWILSNNTEFVLTCLNKTSDTESLSLAEFLRSAEPFDRFTEFLFNVITLNFSASIVLWYSPCEHATIFGNIGDLRSARLSRNNKWVLGNDGNGLKSLSSSILILSTNSEEILVSLLKSSDSV